MCSAVDESRTHEEEHSTCCEGDGLDNCFHECEKRVNSNNQRGSLLLHVIVFSCSVLSIACVCHGRIA